MMSALRIAGAVLAAGLAGASGAQAAPSPARGGACFWSRDVTNWRAVGERQVNLEVLNRDVYRLDLAQDCPQLKFAGQAIELAAGGTSGPVCASSLPDIIVPRQGGIRCPVSKITKLTADQVKSLPKAERP